MITGSSTPSNVNTNELDLNNGGWILIAILICIIVIMTIIICVMGYKRQRRIETLQELLLKNIFTEEDKELLSKYHSLNDRDKMIIRETLEALEKNNNPKKE